AVDGEGAARAPYLGRLKSLVERLEALGMVADVTLTRGTTAGGAPRLQSLAAHRRAVATLVAALQPHRNWYLDLANERNVGDKRFASYADLTELRKTVRALDPARLVTASHGSDIDAADLRA